MSAHGFQSSGIILRTRLACAATLVAEVVARPVGHQVVEGETVIAASRLLLGKRAFLKSGVRQVGVLTGLPEPPGPSDQLDRAV